MAWVGVLSLQGGFAAHARALGEIGLAARQVRPGGASAVPPVPPGAGSERDRRSNQKSFGWLDIEVERNAYGRQLDSFEDRSDEGLSLVFIRAPRITAVGSGASVLARWRGEPVLVRGGAVTGAAFHPELTPDRRVHRLAFAAIVESATARPARSAGDFASAASGDVPGQDQDPGAGPLDPAHASERRPLHRSGA